MLRMAVVSCALLLSATLAGCTLLGGGDGRNGDLVRIVELNFDPAAFEGDINDATDVFAALGETRFEYTHDADAVNPDDVTVEYTDEAGRDREVALSTFTDLDSVARGDKVTIDGVLLSSAVKVRSGENLLASRGSPAADWLEAGGYPLPLAMRGGLAVWDVSGGLELDAGMDFLEVVQEGVESEYRCKPTPSEPGHPSTQECASNETAYRNTFRLENATAEADTDLNGELRLDSVGTALNPAMELGLEGTWVLAALFNVHVFDERTGSYPQRTEGDFGFELDVTAVGDGALTFRFDREGNVVAGGGRGDLDVEGSLVMWDDEHARSEGYSPMDPGEFDVHTPYEEDDLYLDDNPVGFIAQALADLWRMDLAPGDEFHFSSGDRFGADLPTASLTIRVIDEGKKTVPAGTFNAVRVETTSVVQVPIDGAAPELFQLPTLTTWIDSASGIPIAIEQSMSYDYDEQDFAPLFDVAENWDEGMNATPPNDLYITLEGRTLVELEEWKSGLRMAPMASILMPIAAFAAPFASMIFMPYGYGFATEAEEPYPESYPEAYPVPAPPHMEFNPSPAGPGGQITVVSAENGVFWTDLEILGGSCIVPTTRSQVMAGDQIVCALDGRVTIVHLPTGMELYRTIL